MSVIVENEVNLREFSGWTEPQLPSGYWSTAAIGIGDATGGLMAIQINFSRATSQRNSQFYSLEQLAIWQQVSGSNSGILRFGNWDLGRGSGIDRSFLIRLIAGQQATSPAAGEDLDYLKGFFLGRQFNPNTTTDMIFILDNIDTRVFNLRAEGYVWGARSVNVSGGPQRPSTGLYR